MLASGYNIRMKGLVEKKEAQRKRLGVYRLFTKKCNSCAVKVLFWAQGSARSLYKCVRGLPQPDRVDDSAFRILDQNAASPISSHSFITSIIGQRHDL